MPKSRVNWVHTGNNMFGNDYYKLSACMFGGLERLPRLTRFRLAQAHVQILQAMVALYGLSQ